VFFIEMWPDKNQSGGNLAVILQWQKEQFGLVANLLEGVKLIGGIGETKEALGPENRGWKRSQETLKRAAFHRRDKGQEKRRGRVR
jgi:hypothetical protein